MEKQINNNNKTIRQIIITKILGLLNVKRTVQGGDNLELQVAENWDVQ